MPVDVDPAYVNINRQVKAAQARLKIQADIISEIFHTAELASSSDTLELKTDLEANVELANEAYTKYQNIFDTTVDLTVSSDQGGLFPRDTDLASFSNLRTQLHFIRRTQKLLSTAAQSASVINNSNSLNQTQTTRRFAAIALPKFHGEYREWATFRDLFETLILNDVNLTSIEKYHYLLDALKGSASAAVAAVPFAAENFLQAWEALKSHYDSKRRLATFYLDRIFQFSKLKSPASRQALDSLLQKVVEGFTSFNNLHLDDPADFLKFYITLRCLDPDSRKLFETENIKSEFPPYQSLVDFIRSRCKVLSWSDESKEEKIFPHVSKPKPTSPKRIFTTERKSPPPSPPSQRKRSCLCCDKGNHPLDVCKEFKALSVKVRRGRVCDWKLCFVCLRPGHSRQQCKSKTPCTICKLNHHTLLHEQVSSPPSKPNNPNPSSAEPQSSGWVGSAVGDATVLLGTVNLQIFDGRGRRQKVRAVLDTGSQFSLMTQACARRLQLSTQADQTAMLGVGGTPLSPSKGQTTCVVTSPKEPFRHLRLSVKPLLIDKITSPLPARSLSDSIYKGLPTELLADRYFGKRQPVDFLIGNDLLGRVLAPNSASSPILPELSFISTVFGLAVIGPVPGSQLVAPSTSLLNRRREGFSTRVSSNARSGGQALAGCPRRTSPRLTPRSWLPLPPR